MKKHLKINVNGKVKKVGFRFCTMQAAYKHGIFGFVRNKSNGSVYIEAEGEEEALEHFLEWCKTGPIGANVSSVETEEGEVQNFTSFEIKH